MKKWNKNSLVFIFAILFILIGMCTSQYIRPVLGSIRKFAQREFTAEEMNQNIESTAKGLLYHGALMDVDSLRMNLLGTRIVPDKEVIKSDSGSLIKSFDALSTEEIGAATARIAQLQAAAEKNDAQFLYCAIPAKTYYETVPSNVSDYSKQNYDTFIDILNEYQVPYLDIAEIFGNSDVPQEDLYFKTDHHWKPYTGFLASKAICEKLEARYGFSYNKEYADIENYQIETFRDYYLGGYGKKVGSLFTFAGPDDLDVITPTFETDFTEEYPNYREPVRGSYNDVLLNYKELKKDYYHASPYSIYSKNQYRLRVLKNHNSVNKSKALVIQTSICQTVTPYLAMQFDELHLLDIRSDQGFTDDPIDVEQYIEAIKPDYVLVVYNNIYTVDNDDNRYDFFL